MPWEIVAVTHMKEASFRMNAHLHNGDPLTARTVQVPKGRIPGVKPPYTFTQSAKDAITYHADGLGIDLGRYKWDEVNALFWLETYNGFGYRNRGINSPYLYSYTNLYSKGLFYADRKFSSTKVSKSPGCVPVLKALGWVPFA
jgi:lysozyme family protein